MKAHEAVNEYLDSVCAQIRFRQAHETVRRELLDHIEDQAESYAQQGLDEGEAAGRAIADMGDPKDVGLRLDAAYRPKPTLGVLLLLLALLALGVLLRFTVYREWTLDNGVLKYALSLMAGAGLFVLFYRLNLYRFAKIAPYLYAGVVLLMMATYFGVASGAGGYRAWMSGVQYTPCVLPLLLAGLMYSLRGMGVVGLLICGAAVAAPALVLNSLPAVGVLSTLILSCLIVMTAGILSGVFGGSGRAKALNLILTYGGVAAVAAAMLISDPNRMMRLTAALDPASDPAGNGYMASNVLSVLDASRFMGQGAELAGAARFAGDLTAGASFDAVNCYLLTHLIHRFGYIALVAVALAFLALVAVGAYRALRLKSLLGRLACLAVIATLGVQAFGYIAANLGFVLGEPLPLPFVSYGNAALAVNLAMAGLMCSLLRSDGLYTDGPYFFLVKRSRQEKHNGAA